MHSIKHDLLTLLFESNCCQPPRSCAVNEAKKKRALSSDLVKGFIDSYKNSLDIDDIG